MLIWPVRYLGRKFVILLSSSKFYCMLDIVLEEKCAGWRSMSMVHLTQNYFPPPPPTLEVNIDLYRVTDHKILIILIHEVQQRTLKGQCHRIFCFRFASWITFPQAPENNSRVISNFFKNLGRYSQVKVHHQCQRHRWQICHRFQWHRWKIAAGINEAG